MQSTANYGLKKPESTEYYNVADFNENMDIIDRKLKEAENSTAEAKNTTNNHTSNKSNPHNVTKEQVGLGNVDNTSDTNKPVSTAQQQAIDTVQNSIDEHTENTLNPHKVTAKQVGLENVNNTADIDKPVSTAQQDAIDLAYHNSNLYTDEKIAELINGAPTTLDTLKEISDAMTEHEEVVEALNDAIGKKANETEFNSHTSNKSNPHNVTKEQVGLGNVPNVATNDQTPIYTVATADANLTSGEKLSVAFGKIAKAISSLISHLANKSNPHAVTKAQVGLGNCDNTSDIDKPISTATQTALNEINSNLVSLIKVVSSGQSIIIDAGEEKTIDFTVDVPDGYKLVGVIGYSTASASFTVHSLCKSNDTTIKMSIKSIQSVSSYVPTSVYALCVLDI